MLSRSNSQTPDPGLSDRRLTSWKSIGAYFDRDERTVKRWEAQRGMPVHRVPGAGRSSVYAYISELAEWLKTADLQTPLAPEIITDSDDAPCDSTVAPANGAVAIIIPTTGSSFPTLAQPSAMPVSAQAAPVDAASNVSHRRVLTLVFIAAAATFLMASFIAYRSFFSTRSTFAGRMPANLKPAANPEAEELYLQGIYHWNKRTPDSLNQALDDFTQSIVHDPNYAPAYVGLANCYNLLREYTLMPARDAYPRAIAAAERAIALDDSLAEAHNSLAFADFYWNWDAAGAEREFQRAIALDPSSVVAHHWYATFLMVLGRSQQSLAEIEKARRMDPQSSAILADKGLILFHAGQTAQSIALLQRIEATDPSFLSPYSYLSVVALGTDDYPLYLQQSKKAAQLRNDQNRLRILAAAEKGFMEFGANGMFRGMLGVEKDLYAKGEVSAFDLAQTYCRLGDKQQALNLLATALSRHEEGAVAMRVERSLQPLHDDPGFRKLLAQAGLPPFE